MQNLGVRLWVTGLIVLVSGFLTPSCNTDQSSNGSGGKSTTGGAGGQSASGGSAGTMTASGGQGGSAGASPMTTGGVGGVGGAGAAGGAGGTGGTLGGAGGTGGAVAGSGGTGVGGTGGGAGASTGGSAGTSATSGGAGGSGASGGSGGGVGTGTLKIMAIGDSTTQSTCWRAMLWQTLNTAHAGHFDFVGSHKADSGCSPSSYDQDNEAYGSSLLTEAVSGDIGTRDCSPHTVAGNKCPKMSDFIAAFDQYKPDVALIHYGTNDVWNSKPTADIITGFTALTDNLRAANANVKIFVAHIIPMNVTDKTCSGCTCAACSANITALSAAIDAWAPGKSTAASPIAVVDQNTGFDATTDTRDGVHPNDAGSQKMAAKWDAVLEPLF
jgi:lysophospholipase L1-like esterase